MSHSGSLLTIDGTRIPGLKEYKIGHNKLWKDAERNMNGDIRASLIGVFPKLELTFRDALSEGDIRTITNILDRDYFTVAYYDDKTSSVRTAQFYASDYTIPMMNKYTGLYYGFSVSLVPVSKES